MTVKVIQFWEEQVYSHSVQNSIEEVFTQAFPYYLSYATYCEICKISNVGSCVSGLLV